MNPKDWAIVDRAKIFRFMGQDLSRSIIGNNKPKSYAPNKIIFQQGDPATSFYLVLEGWVKLYREMPNGDEVVVALLAQGETFAEAIMFLGGRYPVSAEAVSQLRLLHINGDVLRKAIVENPQISFGMLAASSVHLRHLVEQIEQLKAQSAPKRVANFLLSLTTTTSGTARIALPYEKGLIANRLGMKPESFSRAVGRLRSLGVAVDREFVRIDDVRRLTSFVRE